MIDSISADHSLGSKASKTLPVFYHSTILCHLVLVVHNLRSLTGHP
jgi:hypothetical protein